MHLVSTSTASPESSPRHDRRTALRLHNAIKMQIVDPASSIEIPAAVADISSAGMRILCDEYLAPRTRFMFAMTEHPHLVTQGEVRWTKPASTGRQCGVLFLNLTEEQQQRIDELLNPQMPHSTHLTALRAS